MTVDNVKLVRATADEDLLDCGRVLLNSFDFMYQLIDLWNPSRKVNRQSPETFDKDVPAFAALLKHFVRNGGVLMKAKVDGDTAGIALWCFQHVKGEPDGLRQPTFDYKDLPKDIQPDREFQQRWFDWIFNANRQRLFGDRPRYCLDILAIDPKFQRRQIGHRLVAEGVEKAQNRGLLSVLEASPQGFGLYKKHGYQPVDDQKYVDSVTKVQLDCQVMACECPSKN